MKVSQKQRNLAIQTRSELNYPDQRTWHKKISSKHRTSYNNPKTRKGLWNQKNSTGTKANRSNFLLKLFLHPIATFFRSVSKSKASIPFLLAGQLSAAISPQPVPNQGFSGHADFRALSWRNGGVMVGQSQLWQIMSMGIIRLGTAMGWAPGT